MGPRQHFDRLDVGTVPRHRAMIVTVGADQIPQNLGVTGIRLRTSDVVTVPITSHRQRVDRIHPIPSRHQSLDPQATIRLDPHHHLGRIRDMVGHQVMERPDPVEAFRKPPARQLFPQLTHHMDVVMGLGPIITNKDSHHSSLHPPLPQEPKGTRRRPNGSVLYGTTPHERYRPPSPTSRGTI